MDIVDRLKLFMQNTGLSSSQFADTAQIPRPSFSQIVTGRNKKISNEIFAKLHVAFPMLNMMWLLFGDGDMLADGTTVTELKLRIDSVHPTPHQGELEFGTTETTSNINLTDNHSPNNNSTQNRATINPETFLRIQNDLSSSSKSANDIDSSKQKVISAKQDTSKSIESIMVFYSDNSFEIFRPA